MIGHSNNRIEVAQGNGTAYVRIFGRGTFQVMADFRNFVQKSLDSGLAVLIDLSECETLDSSFIGTLVALSMKSKKNGECLIKIFNVSEHVKNILTTLGLMDILDIRDAAPLEDGDFSTLQSTVHDKVEITNLMLDAHLTLSEINERNALEFKDVVEFLRHQS
ncbi:STAS domain-containing protein [bacterium]|nr:STAS domain-containing protein [bacterium]